MTDEPAFNRRLQQEMSVALKIRTSQRFVFHFVERCPLEFPFYGLWGIPFAPLSAKSCGMAVPISLRLIGGIDYPRTMPEFQRFFAKTKGAVGA